MVTAVPQQPVSTFTLFDLICVLARGRRRALLRTYVRTHARMHVEEPKSFARRDRLAAMEGPAQARWQADKIFEANAEFNEDGSPKEKFMVTFPYPYMNGRLHLGHAYSMSKVCVRIV